MASTDSVAVPEPQQGGSYMRDPATGELTRVAGTAPAEVRGTTQELGAAPPASPLPADAGGRRR